VKADGLAGASERGTIKTILATFVAEAVSARLRFGHLEAPLLDLSILKPPSLPNFEARATRRGEGKGDD
jgi:hypothetical protein